MSSVLQQALYHGSLGGLVESRSVEWSVSLLNIRMLANLTVVSQLNITLSPAFTGAPHSRSRSMVGTEGKLQMGYLPTDEVSLLQARWRGLDPPRPLAPTFTNS